MNPRMRIFVAAALAGIVSVGAAVSDEPLKNRGKTQTEAIKAAAKPQPVLVGKAETAKWTPTTYEAATAEAHKNVLKSGKVATITGEVVDVSCYLQLGKRGEGHIACGSKCIANGQPIGLVDGEDNLYILFAEEHHPRRDGTVDLKKVFAPLLAKQVTVTGMMTETKNYRALFVLAEEAGGHVELMKVEIEKK